MAAGDPPPESRDDHPRAGAVVYFFCLQTRSRTAGQHPVWCRGLCSGCRSEHAGHVLRGPGDLSRRISVHLPGDPFAVRPDPEGDPRTSPAISLGYDVDRYKLFAFILSAALAGLAGATKAIVFQLASLTDVHWTMSGEVVLMTLLVPQLAATFKTLVPTLPRETEIMIYISNIFVRWWYLMIGIPVATVAAAWFRDRGMVGEAGRLNRLRSA
jgi:hypothetical protein